MQIATRESLWDSENIEELKEKYINPNWENLEAFDPDFRWTYREEREVRRVVDLKVMVRRFEGDLQLHSPSGRPGSASCSPLSTSIEATSVMPSPDNMLDDLGLTQADFVSRLIDSIVR